MATQLFNQLHRVSAVDILEVDFHLFLGSDD
jgi:hypothetical protein